VSFTYTPGEMMDLVQGMGQTASHLEEIRGSALNALTAVREEFEGAGGGKFEEAQMLINSGIDAGVEVVNRHSGAVGQALEHMQHTDIANGNTFI
jgi:uncharacterized protein YukE